MPVGTNCEQYVVVVKLSDLAVTTFSFYAGSKCFRQVPTTLMVVSSPAFFLHAIPALCFRVTLFFRATIFFCNTVLYFPLTRLVGERTPALFAHYRAINNNFSPLPTAVVMKKKNTGVIVPASRLKTKTIKLFCSACFRSHSLPRFRLSAARFRNGLSEKKLDADWFLRAP